MNNLPRQYTRVSVVNVSVRLVHRYVYALDNCLPNSAAMGSCRMYYKHDYLFILIVYLFMFYLA